MDSDEFSDESPPQPSRQMPRRAAKQEKLRGPVRITRSSAARVPRGSASDTQLSSADVVLLSDDSDNDDDDDDQTDEFAITHSGRKRKTSQLLTAAAKRPRRSKGSSQAEPSRRGGRPKSRTSPRQKTSQKDIIRTEVSDGLVLEGDWQHLPELIWDIIFDFVAAPIGILAAHQEDVSTAILTLCNATRASKILVEPALRARYKCVHLKTFGAAQHISATLGMDHEQTAFRMRYRTKIETLRIEIGETLSKRVQGQYINLWELIRHLPRLMDVELYHHLDLLYKRDDLEANVRWKYPPELFEALEFVPGENETGDYSKKAPVELRSWTWSSRLAGDMCSLENMASIHQMPSFSTLRKLTFLNYQVPSLGTKVGDDAALALDLPDIQRLASAVCLLPQLQHLAFKSSTIVNGHLLGLLPKSLQHLELHDCYDITAEALQEFLLTHGHHMQQLTLDHCRALNLDFLSVLRDACPSLTHLSMDLRYFRYIESYPDNNPDYAELLGSEFPPTWPRTLQYLNIQSMRFEGQTPLDSATTLLRSLVVSASALPNLRHLTLRASVNVSRNERYKFRETWVSRLERIFKRESPEPKKTARRTFTIPIQTVNMKGSHGSPVTPARRSTRIADRPPSPPTPGDIFASISKREEKIVQRLRKESKRLRVSSKGYHADNEESEDELSVSGSGSTPSTPMYKQRLCDVVDIQIDNQKITEHHYTENDFLDSPPDDDDDEEYED
ncbi:hypothetical protein G7054_g9278 [Neopestalotiopsis clavispora]|nr:hypothetical protein G7054_g9278 [Neopestalotiopsis clavispora]